MRPLATLTAAVLGATLVAAAPAAGAVDTGTSAHGTQHWRLDGRRLTLDLGRPLDAAHPHLRSTVRIECGEATLPIYDGIDYVWAARGARILRVPGGARTIRAMLGRDVSLRANHCLADVGEDYPDDFRQLGPARLTLVHAQRPRCQPGPSETVTFRSPHAIVASSHLSDDGEYYAIWRWCSPPTGAWHRLETAYAGGGGGGYATGPSQWVGDGDRLAWVWELIPNDGSSEDFSSVRTIDFADRMPEVHRSPAPGSSKEERSQLGAIDGLVMAPSGTLAWITSDFVAATPPQVRNQQRQRIDAWRPGGSTVALATATADVVAPPPITALALGADGASATWLDGGVTRSAPLPAGG